MLYFYFLFFTLDCSWLSLPYPNKPFCSSILFSWTRGLCSLFCTWSNCCLSHKRSNTLINQVKPKTGLMVLFDPMLHELSNTPRYSSHLCHHVIAVFEGGHFPRRTLPTRSNDILIASIPTSSSIPSIMGLCLIVPSVNSASPRNPYWFINSIHFSWASRTLFEPSSRLVQMQTSSQSSSSAL